MATLFDFRMTKKLAVHPAVPVIRQYPALQKRCSGQLVLQQRRSCAVASERFVTHPMSSLS